MSHNEPIESTEMKSTEPIDEEKSVPVEPTLSNASLAAHLHPERNISMTSNANQSLTSNPEATSSPLVAPDSSWLNSEALGFGQPVITRLYTDRYGRSTILHAPDDSVKPVAVVYWYEKGASAIVSHLCKLSVRLCGPVTWVKRYTWLKFRSDFVGSLVVVVMAVPQAMAYAGLANLPPVHGLYASCISQLVYLCFGTVEILGVGPVALLSMMTGSRTQDIPETQMAQRVELASELAVETAIILLIFSILQFGIITRFVSHSVTSGFASGAAVLILLSQCKHFFGIKTESAHTAVEYIIEIVKGMKDQGSINSLYILICGLIMTVYLIAIRLVKAAPLWIPHQLIVVVISTFVCWVAKLHEVISMPIVGYVPAGFPPFEVPTLSRFGENFSLAVMLAVVGFVESYAIARKFGDDRGFTIPTTRELFSLSTINMFSSFFQGYVTAGSITKTAVSGVAETESPLFVGMAGVIELIVLVGLNRLNVFYYTPWVTLASIIAAACSRMFDIATIQDVWKTNKGDCCVLIGTILGVIFLGIEWGIIGGILLSIAHVVIHLSLPYTPELGVKPTVHSFAFRNALKDSEVRCYEHIVLLGFNSPIFFVNADLLVERVREVIELEHHKDVQFLVVNCDGVTYADATGVKALVELKEWCEKCSPKCTLLLAGMKWDLREVLEMASLWPKHFNPTNVFPTVIDALAVAQSQMRQEDIAPGNENWETMSFGGV